MRTSENQKTVEEEDVIKTKHKINSNLKNGMKAIFVFDVIVLCTENSFTFNHLILLIEN